MKRMVASLGLAMAVVLTAATVFAWGPGMGRGSGHGCDASAVPNLTAEQAAKIQKIQSDRYAEASKVRSEMYAKRVELQGLFREPVLDHSKIASKQQEIVALRTQMQEKGMVARTAAAEILTPEQRAQLPANGPGFGGGRGRGMGFGNRR
jgi:Spy/CpxP family protein refolding chaperone